MAKDKSGFNPDRDQNEMRHVEVELDFTPNALASVLYRQGDTVILACVTKERSLPRWFPRDATKGWVHAEYSLLPASTDSRFRRERNGAKGRTQEIERLIARSLRAAVDLEALGPVAINIDCDVLNADGGTRCASITAAGIALRLAVRRLIASGEGRRRAANCRWARRATGWSAKRSHPKEMMVRADSRSGTGRRGRPKASAVPARSPSGASGSHSYQAARG